MKDGSLLASAFDFIVVTVFFRYMLLPWFGKILARWFKRLFIKTEHDMAVWLHFNKHPDDRELE